MNSLMKGVVVGNIVVVLGMVIVLLVMFWIVNTTESNRARLCAEYEYNCRADKEED